jgi:hypothetical protein
MMKEQTAMSTMSHSDNHVHGVTPLPRTTRLDPKDLFDLLGGRDVPGLDPADPTVQSLRAGLPTEVARKAFAMARREMFLHVEVREYTGPNAVAQLKAVWAAYCAAVGRPPITLTVMPAGHGHLHCDLSSSGQYWTLASFGVIGRLLEVKPQRVGYQWAFTTTMLDVDGLEAGDAVALARSVVWLATGEGFRGGE